MKTGIIPSSWFGMTGTMSATRLLNLLEQVKKQGVDPNDLAKVSEIWKKVRVRRSKRRKN